MDDGSGELTYKVACAACGYKVFVDKEDSFFEICPVCRWQNDGTSGDEYSGCNHSTLNKYIKEDDFKNRVIQGAKIYTKS